MEAGETFQILYELVFALVILMLWLTGYLSAWPHTRTVRDRGVIPPKIAAPDSSEQLRDFRWVAQEVAHLSGQQPQRAFSTYRSAVEAGLSLANAPEAERDRLLAALAASAVGLGTCGPVHEILGDLRAQGLGVTEALLTSVVESCTARRLFAECLSIFEAMARGRLLRSLETLDGTIWSCLVLCAVECEDGCRQQGKHFLSRLRECGTLAPEDLRKALRLALLDKDWELSLELLEDKCARGGDVDVVEHNMALDTCVGAERVDKAHQLLLKMERREIADVTSYNILMRGYAKIRLLEKCLELRQRMLGLGIRPSKVTYSILLGVCVDQGAVKQMADVFNDIEDQRGVMDTPLYTKLIEGLVGSGEVERAMSVYEQMSEHEDASPDVITFSVLIKANCDSDRLDDALKLLDRMKTLGQVPDETIYNNLLAACALQKAAVQGERVYMEMTQANVWPSNVTFSILIRLFFECGLLDKAVMVLDQELSRYCVSPEPRLFLELIQCCICNRQGLQAVQVLRRMQRHVAPDPASLSCMLRDCRELNLLDAAAEMVDIAAASQYQVDEADLNALLEVALCRKSAALMVSCSSAARRLGRRLDLALLAQLGSQLEAALSVA